MGRSLLELPLFQWGEKNFSQCVKKALNKPKLSLFRTSAGKMPSKRVFARLASQTLTS
jgi:hypothetical protein